MKAKPRAKSKSTAKPALAKKASKVTKKATVELKPAAKRVKNKVTAKKKVPDTGIVAAVKREAAKVTAVAEAVVEVVQEEFAKVKRSAKKVSRKKK